MAEDASITPPLLRSENSDVYEWVIEDLRSFSKDELIDMIAASFTEEDVRDASIDMEAEAEEQADMEAYDEQQKLEGEIDGNQAADDLEDRNERKYEGDL